MNLPQDWLKKGTENVLPDPLQKIPENWTRMRAMQQNRSKIRTKIALECAEKQDIRVSRRRWRGACKWAQTTEVYYSIRAMPIKENDACATALFLRSATVISRGPHTRNLEKDEKLKLRRNIHFKMVAAIGTEDLLIQIFDCMKSFCFLCL